VGAAAGSGDAAGAHAVASVGSNTADSSAASSRFQFLTIHPAIGRSFPGWNVQRGA
jgi:hypothetical protein